MKKILLLLLFTVASYGQAVFDEGIQITGNANSATATKVNVQEANGTINTISKSDLVNVVEVNDVPSLPLIGNAGKIYVVKNVNKIYRWNGTFYQELAVTDISGKEDIANKQNSLAVDGTNTKYPTVTAVNTGLGLKANLASPTFTGTPTAPTATAGTNTTQVATTAFVTGAITASSAVNLKTTGNQSWTGQKGGSNLTTGAATVLQVFNNSTVANAIAVDFTATSNSNSTLLSLRNQSPLGGNGLLIDNTTASVMIPMINRVNGVTNYTLAKNGDVTATSFTKSSTPATNILLAGGGDIAQNTAFNKPFGITAGTVVEGGTLGSNAYTSTAYLPLSGGTLSGSVIIDNGFFQKFSNSAPVALMSSSNAINGGSSTDFNTYVYGNNPFRIWTDGGERLRIGGDGNATFTGTVTATSYTATSLPVFENNAAASSLSVGQFYRTSIGVLMVKF